MRNRIKWMTVATALLLGLTTACDKDDSPVPDKPAEEGVFNVDKNAPVNPVEALLDSVIYRRMLSGLMTADTLPGGVVVYHSRLGHKLYPERPDVHYVGVETEAEAAGLFRNRMVPALAKDSIRALPDGGMKFSTIGGTLTYRAGDGDALATVDVDLPDVPSISQYVFILNSEWPLNDEATPFRYGQIWQRDNGLYYICVKEWDAQSNGHLLTFDGGWSEEWFTTYLKCYKAPFFLYENCAGWTAFQGLAFYMHYRDESFRKKIEEMKKQFPDERWKHSKTLSLLEQFQRVPASISQFTFNLDSPTWCVHAYTLFEPNHYHVWADLATLDKDCHVMALYWGCENIAPWSYRVNAPWNATPSSEYIFDSHAIQEDGKVRIGMDVFTPVAK